MSGTLWIIRLAISGGPVESEPEPPDAALLAEDGITTIDDEAGNPIEKEG